MFEQFVPSVLVYVCVTGVEGYFLSAAVRPPHNTEHPLLVWKAMLLKGSYIRRAIQIYILP